MKIKPNHSLELAISAMMLAAALSFLFTRDPLQAGLIKLVLGAGYLLVFYILVTFPITSAARRFMLYGLLVIGWLFAVVALNEVIGYYWGCIGRGDCTPYPYRLAHVLWHPNVYMAFMNLIAPLAVAALLDGDDWFSPAFCLAVYLITVPFSSSRGGWLGMAVWVAGMLFFWLQRRGWINRRWFARLKAIRTGVILAAIAGMAGLLVTGYGAYRLFSSHPSHSSRMHFWTLAVDAWLTSPVVGIGIGGFQVVYIRAFHPAENAYVAPHAHNLFMTTLAEQGLVGMAALIGLMVVVAMRLLRGHRLNSSPVWSGAMLAALAGWLAHSLVDDFTYNYTVMLVVALLAALVPARDVAAPVTHRCVTATGWSQYNKDR